MSGATTTEKRLHGTVSVGDELPELAYPVTATTVVLGALAARDWRPMHHDKDFAVEPQRYPGHLPQHPQPGRLVRTVHHRLDRPLRPPPAGHLPDARLHLPRRHHGVPGDRHRDRGRRNRCRLGGHRHLGVGGRRRQDHLYGPGGAARVGGRQPLGPNAATGGGRERRPRPVRPRDRRPWTCPRRANPQDSKHPNRRADHVGPAIQPGTRDAARDSTGCVRHRPRRSSVVRSWRTIPSATRPIYGSSSPTSTSSGCSFPRSSADRA